jgi:hypothetical protein
MAAPHDGFLRIHICAARSFLSLRSLGPGEVGIVPTAGSASALPDITLQRRTIFTFNSQKRKVNLVRCVSKKR